PCFAPTSPGSPTRSGAWPSRARTCAAGSRPPDSPTCRTSCGGCARSRSTARAPSRPCCGPGRTRTPWQRSFDRVGGVDPRRRPVATAEQTFEHLRAAGLDDLDPDVAGLIDRELGRQRDQLELIASENFTWPAVLEAASSVLTNKYAEGYPGKRYYGGCEWVDEIEQLAIDRAKALFGADHA